MSNESRMCGDVAKLRKALKLAITMSEWCCAETDDPLECCVHNCIYQKEPHGEAGKNCPWKKIRAALAAPPRNCDNHPNADRAELEYRAFCERMGIDSSIYGAMAWMLADDTEKLEGGNNDGDK